MSWREIVRSVTAQPSLPPIFEHSTIWGTVRCLALVASCMVCGYQWEDETYDVENAVFVEQAQAAKNPTSALACVGSALVGIRPSRLGVSPYGFDGFHTTSPSVDFTEDGPRFAQLQLNSRPHSLK